MCASVTVEKERIEEDRRELSSLVVAGRVKFVSAIGEKKGKRRRTKKPPSRTQNSAQVG